MGVVNQMIAESGRCLDILSYDSRSEMEENGDCCVSEQTRFIKTHIPHASAAPELIVFYVILRHIQSIPFLKYKTVYFTFRGLREAHSSSRSLFHWKVCGGHPCLSLLCLALLDIPQRPINCKYNLLRIF